MLSEKQIQDYQNIYEKQLGRPITKAEATRAGIKLVELMKGLISHNTNEANNDK